MGKEINYDIVHWSRKIELLIQKEGGRFQSSFDGVDENGEPISRVRFSSGYNNFEVLIRKGKPNVLKANVQT